MLRNIKDLEGYTILAQDQEVGIIQTFYFGEQDWTIHYMVSQGSGPLSGRRLLFSPVTFEEIDDHERELYVDLPVERIVDSPSIIENRPLSREDEIELNQYYDWPFYWEPGDVPDTLPGDLSAVPLIDMMADVNDQTAGMTNSGEAHLRSTREMIGFTIQARDGDIGRVDDFIVDDRNWRILYMIVDTGSWLPGKKVVVSPSWIENISWQDSTVAFDLKRETIKNSPEYDPTLPLEREYENRLYDYYNREKYW